MHTVFSFQNSHFYCSFATFKRWLPPRPVPRHVAVQSFAPLRLTSSEVVTLPTQTAHPLFASTINHILLFYLCNIAVHHRQEIQAFCAPKSRFVVVPFRRQVQVLTNANTFTSLRQSLNDNILRRYVSLSFVSGILVESSRHFFEVLQELLSTYLPYLRHFSSSSDASKVNNRQDVGHG